MKKTFNEIKVSLTTLLVAVVSFFSKVIGQSLISDYKKEDYEMVSMYAAPYVPLPEPKTNIAIKVVQRTFAWVTFIIWIINLIKIKKTDDKIQRKKRIKRTIIIMSILVVVLVAAFLIPTLLLK